MFLDNGLDSSRQEALVISETIKNKFGFILAK